MDSKNASEPKTPGCCSDPEGGGPKPPGIPTGPSRSSTNGNVAFDKGTSVESRQTQAAYDESKVLELLLLLATQKTVQQGWSQVSERLADKSSSDADADDEEADQAAAPAIPKLSMSVSTSGKTLEAPCECGFDMLKEEMLASVGECENRFLWFFNLCCVLTQTILHKLTSQLELNSDKIDRIQTTAMVILRKVRHCHCNCWKSKFRSLLVVAHDAQDKLLKSLCRQLKRFKHPTIVFCRPEQIDSLQKQLQSQHSTVQLFPCEIQGLLGLASELSDVILMCHCKQESKFRSAGYKLVYPYQLAFEDNGLQMVYIVVDRYGSDKYCLSQESSNSEIQLSRRDESDRREPRTTATPKKPKTNMKYFNVAPQLKDFHIAILMPSTRQEQMKNKYKGYEDTVHFLNTKCDMIQESSQFHAYDLVIFVCTEAPSTNTKNDILFLKRNPNVSTEKLITDFIINLSDDVKKPITDLKNKKKTERLKLCICIALGPARSKDAVPLESKFVCVYLDVANIFKYKNTEANEEDGNKNLELVLQVSRRYELIRCVLPHHLKEKVETSDLQAKFPNCQFCVCSEAVGKYNPPSDDRAVLHFATSSEYPGYLVTNDTFRDQQTKRDKELRENSQKVAILSFIVDRKVECAILFPQFCL